MVTGDPAQEEAKMTIGIPGAGMIGGTVGPLPQARRFDRGIDVFDSNMSGPQVRADLGVA